MPDKEINVDSVDLNPEDDVMDLFPTDHEVEEESTTDEIVEETETDESQTEEVEDEESTEESEEEVEETETVLLEDLEIKVLGEVKTLKDIPREELQSKIRKGEDYDRIREKYNNSQENINEWNEIAQLFDMDSKQVKDALLNQHFTKIAEANGRSADDVKKEYFANKKSIQDKMYENFIDKYPDVKIEELPDTVTDAVKLGKDITEAYKEHLRNNELSEKEGELSKMKDKIAELEAKLNVKTQNKTTKKKGVIKKTSGNDSTTETDDFLLGLTGGY